MTVAAAKLGMETITLRKQLVRHPELREAVEVGRGEARAKIEELLYAGALGLIELTTSQRSCLQHLSSKTPSGKATKAEITKIAEQQADDDITDIIDISEIRATSAPSNSMVGTGD